MNGLGIALLALAAGVAVGVALVSLRRPIGRDEERLEARLEVQAAELRRIADGAAARDVAGEQLRVDLAGARRVLEQLRERELEHGEVVRRLSSVLAGGASKGR